MKYKKSLTIITALTSVVAVFVIIHYVSLNDTNKDQGENSEIDREKSSASNVGENSKEGSANESQVELIEPYGDFISNHSIVIGSESSQHINSICKSTPGAECKIVFTNLVDASKKELPTKQVEGSGFAEWFWSLDDVRLTEGTWQVEAVASLNTDEISTVDPVNLEITR